jgi:hypothetical protein
MGATESKMRCLFLPAQSGKTRKVEEEIREYKRIIGLEGRRSLDIFISANNRLLVAQTTARMKRDLGTATTVTTTADTDSDSDPSDDCSSLISAIESVEEKESSNAVIKGAVFSWTCGTTSNIKVKELICNILDDPSTCVEMIILCANRRRLNYLAELLTALTAHRCFRMEPMDINIWIDEADSSLRIWNTYTDILALPAVTRITLVSATFDTVIRKYGHLRIIPYAETHPDCYRRLRDCIQCPFPFTPGINPAEYVLAVLHSDHSLLAAGQRAFIPGDYTKESHYLIRDALCAAGFAVIILNGECKELRIPDGTIIDLRSYLTVSNPEVIPDEFNQTLAKLYVDYHLDCYPFAITGYLCVQRGVTFQSSGFLFDYGIIPPITNAAEAYQMMARMFGNIGHLWGYKAAKIFTDSKTFERVYKEEETAVNLPRIMYEEGMDIATKDDFSRAARHEEEKDYDLLVANFKTPEEANVFLVENGCRRNNKHTEEDRRDVTDPRFLVDSLTGKRTVLSYATVVAETSRWSKTSGFDGVGARTGTAGRMYICYRDLSDPSSICFFIRILKLK